MTQYSIHQVSTLNLKHYGWPVDMEDHWVACGDGKQVHVRNSLLKLKYFLSVFLLYGCTCRYVCVPFNITSVYVWYRYMHVFIFSKLGSRCLNSLSLNIIHYWVLPLIGAENTVMNQTDKSLSCFHIYSWGNRQ